jgi:cytochrome P450
MEMKLVLATILANHRLKLASDRSIQPVRRGITFVPSPHFRLQVVG